MKTHLLGIAIALSAATGIARADPPSSLSSVTVRAERSATGIPGRSPTLDCTPPNSAAECAAFHSEIRHNFTNREIGVLFGATTAFPELRNSRDRIVRRYEAFVRAYDEQHLTAFASK